MFFLSDSRAFIVFMILESPVTKIIGHNIFESMTTHRFYILFLFVLIFDFQNKNKVLQI